MTFRCTLENTGSTAARLAVDYVVHYIKANGQTAPKVFKLAVLDLAPGERRTLGAAHEFRQMTTRRHYAGKHSLQLQVNGVRYGGLAFELELAEAADPSGQ